MSSELVYFVIRPLHRQIFEIVSIFASFHVMAFCVSLQANYREPNSLLPLILMVC